MGSVAQIGLGIIILGAAFILGHYVNQNSSDLNQTQLQAEADDEIVWQSNQTVQELRDQLKEVQPADNRPPAVENLTVPKSSMPIAGMNNRPVVRKPDRKEPNTEIPAAELSDPFSASANDVRILAPKIPAELPPLNPQPGEPRIIQPDFSGLLAAAESSTPAGSSNTKPINDVTPAAAADLQKKQTGSASQIPDVKRAIPPVYKGDWISNNERDLPKRDSTTFSPPDSNEAAQRMTAVERRGDEKRAPLKSEAVSTRSTALKAISRMERSRLTVDTEKYLTYKTRSNDTLQSISIRYFGKPDYYLDIYLANRDALLNPANVPTGIALRIPVYSD